MPTAWVFNDTRYPVATTVISPNGQMSISIGPNQWSQPLNWVPGHKALVSTSGPLLIAVRPINFTANNQAFTISGSSQGVPPGDPPPYCSCFDGPSSLEHPSSSALSTENVEQSTV